MDSPYASEAVRLGIHLLGHEITQNGFSDSIYGELQTFLGFVATRPTDFDARFALEEMLEDQLEAPASERGLMVLAFQMIHKCVATVKKADFVFTHSAEELARPTSNTEDVHAFVKGFMTSVTPSEFVFGHGKLPESLCSYCSPGLLRQLYHMVGMWTCNHETIEDDYRFLLVLLQATVLVSQHLKDPSNEFPAIRLAIGKCGSAFFHQHARDLAESTILILPQTQPEFSAWRVAQGWACYADAFHRAGHVQAALRLIADLWDEINFAFRKDPPATARDKARLWGVVYGTHPGEPPDPTPTPTPPSTPTK